MQARGLKVLVVVADWKDKGNARYLAGRMVWSRAAYQVFQLDADPIDIATATSQQYWARKRGWIRDVRFAHRPIVEVAKILAELDPGEQVGIAGMHDTMVVGDYLYLVDRFPNVRFVDASDVVANPRAIKTEAELEAFRHSAQIADDGYEYFAANARPGVTEWEITGEVERILRSQGVYDTMILCSEGPYLREPTQRALQPGDFFLFSVELAGPEGYWVEQGGMFSFGAPGERDRRLFDVALRAYESAQPMMKPGARMADVAAAVQQMIKDGGFDVGIWGGHGIGVDVVEKPLVLPDDPGVLTENMVLGFHPHVVDLSSGRGAYVAGTCVVTPEGAKVLSRVPQELHIIRA
jgi:Xaa-Pro aminopeptidase